MFRRKAVEHYLATAERGEVVRVAPPRARALLLVIAAAAIAFAVFWWAVR